MKIARYLASIFLFLAVSAEVAFRIFMPAFGASPQASQINTNFLYDDSIGYEYKPSALIMLDDVAGCHEERLSSEGFRGPERAIPKPQGTFRILALGDSVVETFDACYGHTWTKVLEDRLNSLALGRKSISNYEVINGGIGGYVSWQVLERFKRRGQRYKPDLLLVFVGWNDMLYSSMPAWKPGIDLTYIKQAWGRDFEMTTSRKIWDRIRRLAYRVSYTARLLRKLRYIVGERIYHQKLIRKHRVDSGLTFNGKALDMYLEDLECTYAAARDNGTRVGLITWPAIFKPDLLEDVDINRKAVRIYGMFPLSVRELWAWYERYTQAQRNFASSHPDIILIDAAEAFNEKNKEERLKLFTDLGHLSAKGNRLLADIILSELKRQGEI